MNVSPRVSDAVSSGVPDDPVAVWLAQRTGADGEEGSLLAAGAPVARASHDQCRMWRRHVATGGRGHAAPFELRRLVGDIDVSALAAALDAIVARHEVLRTTFRQTGNEVWQIVGQAFSLDLHEERLDGSSLADQEAALRNVVSATIAEPFDLERGPVLRARLLVLGPREYVLLLVIHHIAFDKWSSSVLFAELAQLYEAARAGQDAGLPALPIQYSDFAEWQRTHQNPAALAEERHYWHAQLRDVTSEYVLPAAGPRSPSDGRLAARLPVYLPPAAVSRLEAVAQANGASLFMALLASFSATLGCWTGREEILLGSPIVARPLAESESLIGLFVNMLPLRIRVRRDESFEMLLKHVREIALEGYEHARLFFDQIIEAAELPVAPHGPPPVQVAFAYDDEIGSAQAAQFGEPLQLDVPVPAAYDLAVVISRTRKGIEGEAVFPMHLFTESAVSQVVRHLALLAAAAAEHPDRPMHALRLPTGPEADEPGVTEDRWCTHWPDWTARKP